MTQAYKLHAVDKTPAPGQKTVTTVCGERVSANRIFATGDPSDRRAAAVNCVGCRAVLRERDVEKQRQKIDNAISVGRECRDFTMKVASLLDDNRPIRDAFNMLTALIYEAQHIRVRINELEGKR